MTVLFRYWVLLLLLVLPAGAYAQRTIPQLIDAEYEAGRFSGAVLVAHEGRLVARVSQGLANRQFAVPIGPDTRFPIASLSKTFTAILVLQLVEQNRVRLADKVGAYLPASCRPAARTLPCWSCLLTTRACKMSLPKPTPPHTRRLSTSAGSCAAPIPARPVRFTTTTWITWC